MAHHERTLHNYFILCRRKYRGCNNQCDICMAHDGKIGCHTIEYTMAILYSDGLHFPWYGIKCNNKVHLFFIFTAI